MAIVKKRKAQIWIETVIYTLIGLTIIGILLAASKPKIDAMKDKLVLEQTIDSMNKINSKINELKNIAGNKRIIDVQISKGKMFIDSANNKIYWVMDSKYQYSEAGVDVKLGELNILTEEGNPWTITISSNFNANIQYKSSEELKEFDAAPTPYTLSIESQGSGGGIIINIE